MGIQAKLMNTIHIILTKQLDVFPVEDIFAAAKRSQEELKKKERRKNRPTSSSNTDKIARSGVSGDSPGFKSPIDNSLEESQIKEPSQS